MNKILRNLVICLFSLITVFAIAKHFWRGETLNIKQVEKKWGNSPFDEKKFLVGTMEERAKMTASLLKQQKKYQGIDIREMRSRFGNYNGFYFTDMYPTYIIEEGKTPQQDTWQIVFLIDRKEKISEIIVHKNCCDR